MMDVEAAGVLPCPASSTNAPIPFQHELAIAGKAGAGMRSGPVARAAQPGDGGSSPPAGAKQKTLEMRSHGQLQLRP